eukprot:gene43862-54496_t
MRNALKRIQNGDYAKMFIQEGRLNYPSMTARRRNTADHSIEKVGGQLRAMMPWIAKNKLATSVAFFIGSVGRVGRGYTASFVWLAEVVWR